MKPARLTVNLETVTGVVEVPQVANSLLNVLELKTWTVLCFCKGWRVSFFWSVFPKMEASDLQQTIAGRLVHLGLVEKRLTLAVKAASAPFEIHKQLRHSFWCFKHLDNSSHSTPHSSQSKIIESLGKSN